MQTVNALFNSIFSTPGKLTDVKLVLNGTTYLKDQIYPPTLTRRLLADDTPAVGGTVAASLDFELKTSATVPRQATAQLYIRLTDAAGRASAWLPKGTFYVGSRGKTPDGSRITFRAYDAMLKGEVPYIEETAFSTWPQPDTAVAAEIADLLGVDLDSRTALRGYSVPYPNDLTAREVLGYIGGANGGNWAITDDNKLRLVKLGSAQAILAADGSRGLAFGTSLITLPSYRTTGTAEADAGRAVKDYRDLGAKPAYTGVRIWWSDTDAYTAGTETGSVLELDCPWATQAMADALLAELQAYVYRSFEASRADLTPAAELGDLVSVDGITLPLMAYTVRLDGTWLPDISAPADDEIDDEYPYETRTEKQLKRKVALGAQYYGTSITRQNGLTVTRTDGSNTYSAVQLNSDLFRATKADGTKVLDMDFAAQSFKWNGDIVIQNGSVTFDSLDAATRSAINVGAQIAEGTYTGGTFIDGTKIFAPNIFGAATLSIGSNGSGYNYTVDRNGNVVQAGSTTISGSISFTGTAFSDITSLISRYGGDDNPSYIHSTYISQTEIYSPDIYGGWFYATGKGADGDPAYYISDGLDSSGHAKTPIGWLSYDTGGDPSIGESSDRVILHSEGSVPIKIEAGGNMSLQAGTNNDKVIYVNSAMGLYYGVNYGYRAQLNAITNPVDGQIFFLLGS